MAGGEQQRCGWDGEEVNTRAAASANTLVGLAPAGDIPRPYPPTCCCCCWAVM